MYYYNWINSSAGGLLVSEWSVFRHWQDYPPNNCINLESKTLYCGLVQDAKLPQESFYWIGSGYFARVQRKIKHRMQNATITAHKRQFAVTHSEQIYQEWYFVYH